MKAKLFLVFLAFGLTGCNFVKGAPSVDAKLDVASQYNFRGVLQNEKPVVQPSASVRVPLSDSSGLGAGVWANGNIRDSTGDGDFPSGDGKSFSEIDLSTTYYQRVGEVEYAVGLINYNYPSRSVATPTQTDAFASAEWEASGWGNAFSAYRSINEFGGLYLRADFSRAWAVNQRVNFDLGLGIAYTDDDNSLLYYQAAVSGFADLSATGSLSYAFDKRTTGALYLSTIQVINDKLEDALALRSIEADNWVLGVSMSWAY